MENDRIFALDIGTRKIVGLVMIKKNSIFEVIDSEMIEHDTRAMLDGQIHDVEAVAGTIARIKAVLEERLNTTLEAAAVAAAGRSLKTAQGILLKTRIVGNEINREEVRAWEIEAVQQAQYNMMQEEISNNDLNQHFCVGYSVIAYRIEGQEIANLVGQVGSQIGVEVIATFLPRVVVDGLFSALRRSGLHVFSLTLEPIAALSVAIPASMRILNLVLVDIGAGTSDIAIIKGNRIYAYAMVPIGGDELTEAIASNFLLDFNYAEEIKRKLLDQEEIEIIDILGNKSIIATKEVIQSMQPVLNDLANHVFEQIMDLNKKAPDAVICVGGGSLTPGVTGLLAEKLGLPVNRVGIKKPENINTIILPVDYLKGPQGVTPLGIAYNSFTTSPVPFIKVNVNNRDVALWNMGELNVAAALLSAGVGLTNLYGKPGMGKTIEINGHLRVIKGEMGTPPVIKINGEPGSLESEISGGEVIEFKRGQDGGDAVIKVKDLINKSEDYVLVNGDRISLQPLVTVNGARAEYNDQVPDRAKVDYWPVRNIRDILMNAGIPQYLLSVKMMKYSINGEEIILQWVPLKVEINDKEVQLSDEVKPASEIKYTINSLRPLVRDVLNEVQNWEITVFVNGQEVKLAGKTGIVLMNDQIVGMEEEIQDNAEIKVSRDENQAILSNIFKVVDIKPTLNRRLVMKVDGEPAGYTTPIYDKSKIELYWEDQ